MKFKICLYFWVVFGPWRGSVASYTTDERLKNGQKERWRLNLEEIKRQIESSSEKFRRLQYVISSKIVKSLENTDFYELRISISSNEYRTILLAVDHDNFIQSKNVLLLNSFLKKDTKQYKAEIKKAENIVKRYLEDWICWNKMKITNHMPTR